MFYTDTKAFIINKLLITYAFRNQDLQLQIIDDKKDIEPDKNWITIMKTRFKNNHSRLQDERCIWRKDNCIYRKRLT